MRAGDCLLAGVEQRNQENVSAQKAGTMHLIGNSERFYYTSIRLPQALSDVACSCAGCRQPAISIILALSNSLLDLDALPVQ